MAGYSSKRASIYACREAEGGTCSAILRNSARRADSGVLMMALDLRSLIDTRKVRIRSAAARRSGVSSGASSSCSRGLKSISCSGTASSSISKDCSASVMFGTAGLAVSVFLLEGADSVSSVDLGAFGKRASNSILAGVPGTAGAGGA